MATIFEPLSQSGYELCHPVDRKDWSTIFDLLDGTAQSSTWKPLKVRLLRKDERGRPRKESDAPGLGFSSALVFRPRAIAALKPTLLAHGELLPLSCDDAELWMFRSTRFLPAIDEERSGVKPVSPEDGRMGWIERYVFRDDVIAGSDIFKLANMIISPTFVTQRFVDLWSSSGLKGIKFTPALGLFRSS